MLLSWRRRRKHRRIRRRTSVCQWKRYNRKRIRNSVGVECAHEAGDADIRQCPAMSNQWKLLNVSQSDMRGLHSVSALLFQSQSQPASQAGGAAWDRCARSGGSPDAITARIVAHVFDARHHYQAVTRPRSPRDTALMFLATSILLPGACRMLVEGHGILHFLVRLVRGGNKFPWNPPPGAWSRLCLASISRQT